MNVELKSIEMLADILSEVKEIIPPKEIIDDWLGNFPLEKCLSDGFYGNLSKQAGDGSAESAFILIDAHRDRLWEEINTGHFSNVNKRDRQFYALATFQKTVLGLMRAVSSTADTEKTIESCVWDLDNAMLLGCPLDAPKYSSLLSDCLNILQRHSSASAETLPSIPFTESVTRPSTDMETDVVVLSKPSIEDFTENHFGSGQPAILRDCMEHWPAMTNWCDPSYLVAVASNRIVPIEVGNNYTNESWSQDLVKFQDFFRRQFLQTEPSKEPSIEYLAQHNLFDQIPRLREDILIPEYCCVSSQSEEDVDIKAWLGPRGTVSPMHHDPKHNLLCQLFGHKRIILAAPDDSPNLYPFESNLLGNTSQIDAENLDEIKFPLVKRAKFYHLTLYRGEMLYIPPKWWHHVRSLSKSFSVSFWWD